MKEYKGYHLYVNLGPSQARRRLRHRGFGVKAVQSAGTGRALIIHTATGAHRAALECIFADVLPPRGAENAGSSPTDLAGRVRDEVDSDSESRWNG